MNKETVDEEILSLLKHYCKPRAVTGLLKGLKQAEAFERKVTGGKKRNSGGRQSFSDGAMLDQLITLCHTTLPGRQMMEVLLGIGDVFRGHGEYARAEDMYTMVVVQGESAAGDGVIGEAYMRRGDVYGRLGRWKDSSADLDQSRRIYRALNRHAAVGKVDNIIGSNLATQGKLKQAENYFQRALTSFEHSEEVLMTGTVLMNLGIVYNIMGEYDVALTHYQRARSSFEEVGSFLRLAELHHNVGMTYLAKGMFNEAVKEFDRGIRLGKEQENMNVPGLAYLGKGNAYFRMGDLRVALTLVNSALDYFSQSNDRLSIADGYKVKGMIHREMNKLSFAESYLHTSLRINLELKNQLNTAETYYEIGLLEKVRSDRKLALTAFEKAREYFRKVGARNEVRRTEAQIAAIEEHE